MKKILLLLIFSVSYINAQTYSFDYKIVFSSYNEKNKKNETNMSYVLNTQNPFYHMQMFNNKNGVLHDYKEKICDMHFFRFYNQDKIKYKFTNSETYITKDEKIINKIIVEKLDENKYIIKCFENEKSEKPNLELTLILKPENVDLIRFYFLDLSNNIHQKIISKLKEKLNGDYNYVIENYIVDYKNGFLRQYKIDKVEKINLKIINL
ncbi:hypothetical protein [Chryseobacterium sp. HMWF035]|uniref:hypothetical protein n=1 Tax=Chryseobacterium sp. HMWF035 TaxID=2056868 RepID=UPI000D568C15|nr:hypothetical protein [Chryseobacterium sp. HMWF035]PVV50795.1 hypothetical protein DD829_21570 [Chryseobacterium sp. HMWF035]